MKAGRPRRLEILLPPCEAKDLQIDDRPDRPVELTIGPDGNLYVSSYFNSSVLRYDGRTGEFVDTVARGGGLERACGLRFGPDGHLYVASRDNCSVLLFDGSTGAFIDEFVAPGSGGLHDPTLLMFLPRGGGCGESVRLKARCFDGGTKVKARLKRAAPPRHAGPVPHHARPASGNAGQTPPHAAPAGRYAGPVPAATSRPPHAKF